MPNPQLTDLDRALDYLAVLREREEALAQAHQLAHTFAEKQRQIVLDIQYASR